MYKILLTGTNPQLVTDCVRRSRVNEYAFVPINDITKHSLLEAIRKHQPRLIVISLQTEADGELEVYNSLKEYDDYKDIPLVVIGDSLQIEAFNKTVWKNTTHSLMRPFKPKDLFDLLKDVINTTAPIIYKEALREKAQVQEVLNNSRATPVSFNHRPLHPTVLIVDDDPKMLRSIKVQLEGEYKVILVNSGKKALDYLSVNSADIILLDYMMPEQDGPTTLKRLRRLQSARNTPVVFLTGVSDRDLAKKCIEMKPQAYLLKPVERKTLVDTIEKFL